MSSVGALEEVFGTVAVDSKTMFSVLDDPKDRIYFPIFLQSDSLQVFLKQFKINVISLFLKLSVSKL
jgi:hypothetical protein